MAKFNAFLKLWVGDYLSDTGTLNTQRHGAYFLLMLEYWKSEKLPKDNEELFLVAKAMTSTAQDDVLFIVDRYFPDGVNKRLDEELDLARISYNKRVTAQLKSVEKRQCNSNAIAMQLAKQLQSSDSDSDYSLLSKRELSDEFEHFWNKWGKGARKADAKAWFLKKGKKKDREFYEMLAKKADEYFEWRNKSETAGVFVPHLPALVVWLNGCRWEDELSDPEQKKTNGAAKPFDSLISQIGTVADTAYPEWDDPKISIALYKVGSWMELCRMTEKDQRFNFKPKFMEAYNASA